MTPLGQAREHVKELLAGIGVNVYENAPEVVTPPAVIIHPASTWIESATLQVTRVNLELEAVAQPAGKNQSALERLEELVWKIQKVFPYIGNVDAPITTKYGQSDLLSATVPVSVHVNDNE
jgi:hypothetical protein